MSFGKPFWPGEDAVGKAFALNRQKPEIIRGILTPVHDPQPELLAHSKEFVFILVLTQEVLDGCEHSVACATLVRRIPQP
jgi:hypothetical protein